MIHGPVDGCHLALQARIDAVEARLDALEKRDAGLVIEPAATPNRYWKVSVDDRMWTYWARDYPHMIGSVELEMSATSVAFHPRTTSPAYRYPAEKTLADAHRVVEEACQ